MKVALFFENKFHEGRNLTNIEKANPCMAGTPYMFFLIGQLLAKRDNGIDVTMMLTHSMNFSNGVRIELVRNLAEAYEHCCRENTDYLIIKHADSNYNIIRKLGSKGKTRLIIWCHNFVNFKGLSFYANNPLVGRLITVSREQADCYRDHLAFQKTDYIYNCVENQLFDVSADSIIPSGQRQHIVTYIGAVIPGKGFHILAKAWPAVLKEVPDAQLYVIGNGQLYGDKFEMGTWNLAEKKYEASFMKYLTRNDHLIPSVHLLGVLGSKKYDILAQTKVGVPNPSGLTETFCISAVEMQMMGAVIVSKRCPAYLDTVRNGHLTSNPKHLSKYIISALRSTKDSYASTRRSIKENFSQEKVILQWEELLTHALPRNERLHPSLPLTHPDFELKRWKEAMRQIKTRHPWLYQILPSISLFVESWKKIQWAIWKRAIL